MNEDLIGKIITLPRGEVVMVDGFAVVNGETDQTILTTVNEINGSRGFLLARVARELPETIRRRSFVRVPGDCK